MRPELVAIGVTNPFRLVRSVVGFAKTVWNPSGSDVQRGINALVNGALRDAGPARVRELEQTRPDIAALFAERYDPELDMDTLAALPDGTLGREYVRFLRANGIDPLATLLEMGKPVNALQYLFRRAYKLHDVMHVVLGCDASILGEVRIVSYSLGQNSAGNARTGRAPALALCVLLLHLALRKPDDFREALRLAWEWMRLGEQSRPHVSFRVEDHLHRPVEEVRALVLAPA